MNQLSATNQMDLNRIKTAFDELSWYKKIFFPGKLATQLNRLNDEPPSIEHAFHVYEAYVNHTWFIQKRAFKSLKTYAKTDLVCALSTFKTIYKLTNNAEKLANFTVIATAQHPIEIIVDALRKLHDAGLLTGSSAQVNRDMLRNHSNPTLLANALHMLQATGLLTKDTAQTNFNAVAHHLNPVSMANALSTLHIAGLLNSATAQANRNAVARHPQPELVARALCMLKAASLLNGVTAQANRDAITHHAQPELVARALYILKTASLLTGVTAQANRDAVTHHQQPESVARALCRLKTASLLTGVTAQANRNAVAHHQQSESVARALCILKTAGLLKSVSAQANRDAITNHSQPESVASALCILKTANLLTDATAQANRDAVTHHPQPQSVARALHILKARRLTDVTAQQANRDAVINHPQPEAMVCALYTLKTARLLTGVTAQVNREALTNHSQPEAMARALCILESAKLLTGVSAQANRDAITNHTQPESVARALCILKTASLLTGVTAQVNRNAVTNHLQPESVARALRTLRTARILTGVTAQTNRDAVTNHLQPESVASALAILQNAALLTGDTAHANRGIIANHPKPKLAASTLALLHRFSLLNADTAHANLDALLNHRDQQAITDALYILQSAGLLTRDAAQANFNAVVIECPAILLARDLDTRATIWSIIPPNTLTADDLQAIIDLARINNNNPNIGFWTVMRYIDNNILNRRQPQAPIPSFNASQSTHTASVHKSSSQSAMKMLSRYQAQIYQRNKDGVIKELSNWLNTLQPQTYLKNAAAIRCVARLTLSQCNYIDPTSNVSTQQLLALAWLGIHDEAARTGTLDDAKMQLVDGLYEIQRGYNLSETGVDDHRQDRPICTSGTFNKIIEKLAGLHTDVCFLYITKQTALYKFPIIIGNEAKRYLSELSTRSPDDHELNEIKNTLENDDMDSLWDKISFAVTELMFDEFGSLFQNKTDPNFTKLVACGVYKLNKDMAQKLMPPNPSSSVAHHPSTLFNQNTNASSEESARNEQNTGFKSNTCS